MVFGNDWQILWQMNHSFQVSTLYWEIPVQLLIPQTFVQLVPMGKCNLMINYWNFKDCSACTKVVTICESTLGTYPYLWNHWILYKTKTKTDVSIQSNTKVIPQLTINALSQNVRPYWDAWYWWGFMIMVRNRKCVCT